MTYSSMLTVLFHVLFTLQVVEPPVRPDFEDDDNEEIMSEYRHSMSMYSKPSDMTTLSHKPSDLNNSITSANTAVSTVVGNPLNSNDIL